MNTLSSTGSMPKKLSFSNLILRRNKLIVEIISGLFILLFVYTAISKLTDHVGFESVLGKSPLITSKMATFLSWAVPISELLVSALLFVPRTLKLGLYSSLILMIGFTSYLAYMIFFRQHQPCSCGGVISQMTWKQHLFFNLFFTLLAITGIWLQRKKRIAK